MPLLLIDLETTSPDRHKAGIVEIAATWYPAHVDPLSEVFTVKCRPYPGAPIDPEALAINGCDWLEDQTVLSECEAVLRLASWICDTRDSSGEIMMMGWNVALYDWLVLERAWKMHVTGPWPFSFRTLDMHAVAVADLMRRGIHVPSGGIKSRLCCEAYGLQPEPKPHRALGGITFEAALADKLLKPQPLDAVKTAIWNYHHALDKREHGGVAQDRCVNAVEDALGAHWKQGATLNQ